MSDPLPLPGTPDAPRRDARAGLWLVLGGGCLATAVLVAIAVFLGFTAWWQPHRLASRLRTMVDGGDYRAALDLAERELPGVRLNGALCFALENLHYEVGDLERTRLYAEKTLALQPDNERAVRLLISISRDFAEDEVAYLTGREWVAQHPAGCDVYTDLALAADAAGREDESLGFAGQAFALRPDDARIAGVYFYYAVLDRGAEATQAEIRQWAADHYADDYFWAQVGKALSALGECDAAIPKLRRALEMGSEDAAVAEELLDCYRSRGDRAEAERFLAGHLRAHEATPTLWRMLGAVQYDAEDYCEALASFRRAQELDPASATTLSNIAFTLIELDDAVGALQEGERWLAEAEHETSAQLERALGNACFVLGRWPAAEGHYRAALELEPDSCRAARALVSTLVRQDRAREAVEFGRRWREANADAGDADFDEVLARAAQQVGGSS